MSVIRKDKYNALLARLQAKMTGVKTFSRHLFTPDQLPATTKQPAVLVIAEHQMPINDPGRPAIWHLHGTIIIYVRHNKSIASGDIPEDLLLDLVDQVESALEYQPGDALGVGFPAGEQFNTTLGGVVQRVWIADKVELYPGVEGEQGIALIPFEMLTIA